MTPQPHTPLGARAVILVLLLTAGLGGCARYHIGAETLYAPDVQTVYVPMIESSSFRRDLGERLTEAVVKEITDKTPYTVVSSAGADSVLAITLGPDVRQVLAEDAYDAPRVLETNFVAEVTWLNRRRQPLVQPQNIALAPNLATVGQNAVFVPAAGQSVISAQQEAISELAEQIVGAMEQPW